MLNRFGEWLNGLWTNFQNLPPTEQVTWVLGTLGAVGAALFWLIKLWLKRQRKSSPLPNADKPLDLASEPHGSATHKDSGDASSPRWEYQWSIGDSILPRAVEPPLAKAIVQEISGAAAAGKQCFLIFVRGELGIGKTTLAAILLKALREAAKAISADHPQISNFIETTVVSEAADLQPPHEFAKQIVDALDDGGAVVALGRPGILDLVQRRLGRSPDAAVTILPFEPARPLFHDCITAVARKFELDAEGSRRLHEIASGFDQKFLRTPFYFEQIALAVASNVAIANKENATPLQIFQIAIQERLSNSGVTFPELVDCALGRRTAPHIEVPGIVADAGFIHDGYRNVVLAAAFVTQAEDFSSIVQCENAIPAVRIILSHLRSSRKPKDARLPFEAALVKFAVEEPSVDNRYYPIFLQGVIADAYRQLKDEAPAEAVRQRCISLAKGRGGPLSSVAPHDPSVWWDISDALTAVGDPRLKQAQHQRFSANSGYFTRVEATQIEVGSNFIPQRSDMAKPVLPYCRMRVGVGPFWVANFLVTNEAFLEFWDHPKRDRHFKATGALWLKRDPQLMRQIGASFDMSARRCFWKELSEQEAVSISGIHSEARSPLELARSKALGTEAQVPLWDPAQADDRFSGRGKPVVGVNWWEAMAFCDWWSSEKLPLAGFPAGSFASLLTDWEWEGVRRLYYEPADQPDLEAYPSNRFAAHTRSASSGPVGARVGNVMSPLHVGLSPAPNGDGPTDMIGNVWEWTRSRVFGRIVSSTVPSAEFGETAWEDGDVDAERNPLAPGRDEVDGDRDLSYRATRGGSFFSRDEQAAWHPAYRLCDPPFDSFIDLGFRFAVYPGETNS